MDDTKEQTNDENAATTSGRFAYAGLERAIHEKARLGIIASLIANPNGLLFGELKELCSLTDGNLNRHLKVLTEANLVEIWKGSRAKRSQTLCRITTNGKTKFEQYIEALERVVADASELLGKNSAGTR